MDMQSACRKRKLKRKLEDAKAALDTCHKKFKSEKQRTRRLLRKIYDLNTLCVYTAGQQHDNMLRLTQKSGKGIYVLSCLTRCSYIGMLSMLMDDFMATLTSETTAVMTQFQW